MADLNRKKGIQKESESVLRAYSRREALVLGRGVAAGRRLPPWHEGKKVDTAEDGCGGVSPPGCAEHMGI